MCATRFATILFAIGNKGRQVVTWEIARWSVGRIMNTQRSRAQRRILESRCAGGYTKSKITLIHGGLSFYGNFKGIGSCGSRISRFGDADPLGVCRPPMWALFGGNVCEMKELRPMGGCAPAAPPGSATHRGTFGQPCSLVIDSQYR